MTLELLHKISKQTLPFTVTDLDEIDKLGSPRFQCNNWRERSIWWGQAI